MHGASNGVLIPELAAIDLDLALFGGQTFRWRPGPDGSADGWIGERAVRVRRTPDGLDVRPRGAPLDGLEAAARRYFDADRDYRTPLERLNADARMCEAATGLEGLRILRQPPFETTIAFIVSANNNIPRIAKCLGALCHIAGRAVDVDGDVELAFPEPAALAEFDASALRDRANLGYRDRYVVETARRVAGGEADLDALERLPTRALLAALRELPGVGPKVAECIALFAYGRFDVFPVDTWVRQAYVAAFPMRGVVTDQRIGRSARRRFGPAAGLAQQVLFESVRRRARARVPQT